MNNRRFPKSCPKIKNHRNHADSYFNYIYINLHSLLDSFYAKCGFAKPPHSHSVANRAQTLFSNNNFTNTLNNYLKELGKFAFAGAVFKGLSDIHATCFDGIWWL